MPAPKGNRFWEARSKHGRDKIFSTPEVLWDAAVEYFVWVDDNPLLETKAWCQQGEVTTEPLPKMRAMTISGLCLFLDIDTTTWENYRKDKDFFRVIKKVEDIIYNQKFSGAAADLLNANIIARDLGLSDKIDNTHAGKNGGPIETVELSPKEYARRLAFSLQKAKREDSDAS